MAQQKTALTSRLAHRAAAEPASTDARMRLDKWLWCARFYKTRSLAVDDLERHRIHVNQCIAKPARDVRSGDVIEWVAGPIRRTVVVRALAASRGPAPMAQQLYEETAQSRVAREHATAQRKLAPEPAHTLREGRPTKKNRRELAQLQQHLREQQTQAHWQAAPGAARGRLDGRWSATLDDDGNGAG